jgi:hypothetical protein
MKAGTALLLAFVTAAALATAGWAQAPQQQKQNYTPAEYNDYQAAVSEKDPATRVKLLDNFLTKYPGSALTAYCFVNYYTSYFQELRNYPKTIEYADKLGELGDKVDIGTRVQASYFRAQAAYLGQGDRTLQTPEALEKTRAGAKTGLGFLEQLPKPENLPQEDFDKQKRPIALLFHTVYGIASSQLKDYPEAAAGFKAALAIDSSDALNNYRLGLASLQANPPQYLDGFWAIARTIALKPAAGVDINRVRTYLRSQMLRYQQCQCDDLLDAQLKELVSLAAASPERPADFRIASQEELQKLRNDTPNFIEALKQGGDKAKETWLAFCGLEYPEIGGKVIEVGESGEIVVVKIYAGTDEKEVEAATTFNMEAHVVGQPEAKRIEKDNSVRFSGTLAAYHPEPFVIRWDKAKVNPEDIPPEKTTPSGKAPAKKAPKKPPTKSSTKSAASGSPRSGS